MSESTQGDLLQLRRSQPARLEPAIDRAPPHSIEAEQGVLGCLLLDPEEGLQYCLEHLRTPRQLDRPKTESGRHGTLRDSCTTFFYELKHQVIFEAMLEMNEARQAVDLITLKQTLTDNNQLEAVGGVAYLSTLMDSVPSAANLEYYFNIIWDDADALQKLAFSSHTRVVVDTKSLSAQATSLANLLAEKIGHLSEKDCEELVSEIERRTHNTATG